MKKNKTIQIVNPQLFVKDYFDHALMKEDGFNVNAITPKEQSCFFVISPIEAGTKYIKFPKESIKINYYEFIFLTDGYCVCTDNLNELKQEKLQIRFVAPGKITSVKELSNDVKGYYCLFDKPFIDAHTGTTNFLNSLPFFDLDAIPIINLTDSQSQFFSMVLNKIQQDFSTNYNTQQASICNYLVAILKECSLFYEKVLQSNNKLTSADRITQEYLRLVNKHYLTKRQLSDYAELLNVTPKHLTKSVKNATGEPPMNFIYKMLILEAQVLLRDTVQSVAEIAFQLSFEDAAYFNRFFKQHTGITPASFRNK
ncbi:MAG: AraC family transcriptional regulator [Bacteroidetes bacterium]|nr:MAG: AraC family transcriptional regulator [Bacteroidota bacterium]